MKERFPHFLALMLTMVRSDCYVACHDVIVKRVPLGVVVQLTAWNHPMLIAIKKIAPALATGNSIVLKPSELAPVTVLEVCLLKIAFY